MLRILLDQAKREELEHISSQVGQVGRRAQMVLLSAQGLRVRQIAQGQHCSEATVRFWLRRYQDRGLTGLQGSPRGRPRSS